MSDSTAIQWTDATWNPTTGCDRISAGCDHCYIERTLPFRRDHRRFDEHGQMGVQLHPDRLDKPLHWRKPRRIFVNSLSDLFHRDIRPSFIASVFDVMGRCPQHTFQVLTKRSQRMASLMGAAMPTPLPNVGLGVSIEDGAYAFRADHLRVTPAAFRFLSLEPLLGPLPSLSLDRIDWVIVGGESGPGARLMKPEWVQWLIDSCDAAGVSVFVKQAGKVLGKEWGCSDGHGADWSSWPEWARRREFPASVSS